MKVRDLVKQLSNYDPNKEIELMYSFYTVSADNKMIKPIIMEKHFTVIEQGESDSILLATDHSLTE